MNLQEIFKIAGMDPTKGKAARLIESIDNDGHLPHSYVVEYQTDAPAERLGVFNHETPIINSIHECEDELVDFRSGTHAKHAEQRLMIQLRKLGEWIQSGTGQDNFMVSGMEGAYSITRQPAVSDDQITPWDY